MRKETKKMIIKITILLYVLINFFILLTITEETIHERIFKYYGCDNTHVVYNNFLKNEGAYAQCLDPHTSSEIELLAHSINDIMFFFMRFILYFTITILLCKSVTDLRQTEDYIVTKQ